VIVEDLVLQEINANLMQMIVLQTHVKMVESVLMGLILTLVFVHHHFLEKIVKIQIVPNADLEVVVVLNQLFLD